MEGAVVIRNVILYISTCIYKEDDHKEIKDEVRKKTGATKQEEFFTLLS